MNSSDAGDTIRQAFQSSAAGLAKAHGTIALTSEDHLPEGQIVTGEVRDLVDTSGKHTTALFINGRQIKASLPEELKAGDTLSLKVERRDGALTLKIISITHSEVASQNEVVRQALSAFLEKVNIPESALNALKQLLGPRSDNTPLPSEARSTSGEHQKEFQNILALARKQESLTRDPLAFAKEIAQSSSEDLKDIASLLGRATSRQNPAPHHRDETFSVVKGQIRELLLGKSCGTSSEVQGGGQNIPSHDTKSAIGKLTEALRSINSRALDAIQLTEQKISDFIRRHLENAPVDPIRRAILLPGEADPLRILKESLAAIDLSELPNMSEIDRRFIRFAATFRENLERVIQKSDGDSTIRKLLVRAERTLRKEFLPTHPGNEQNIPVPAQEPLSQELGRAARAIESQVVSLLSLPRILPETGGDHGPIAELRRLFASLSGLDDEARSPSDKAFLVLVKESSKKLDAIFKNDPTTSASLEQEAKKVLLETLSALYKMEASQSISTPANKAQEPLTPSFQLVAQTISSQIQSILGATGTSFNLDESALATLRESIEKALELPNLAPQMREWFSKISDGLVTLKGNDPALRSLLVDAFRIIDDVSLPPGFEGMLSPATMDLLGTTLDTLSKVLQENLPQGTPSRASVTSLEKHLLASLLVHESDRELLAQTLRTILQNCAESPPWPKEMQLPIEKLNNLLTSGAPSAMLKEGVTSILSTITSLSLRGELFGKEEFSPLPPPLRAPLETLQGELRGAIDSIIGAIVDDSAPQGAASPHLATIRTLLKNLPNELLQGEGSLNEDTLQLFRELEQALDLDAHLQMNPARVSPRRATQTMKEALSAPQIAPQIGNSAITSKEILSALKSVEQMVQGQELLSKMNPIMKAMGEPIFILFPTFMQGLISKVEFSILPEWIEPEMGNEKKKGGANSKGYTRARLSLTLPLHGGVGVDVAYRDKEILVHLTFENRGIVNFALTRAERLEGALRALGFDAITLRMVNGIPDRIEPEWVRALTHSNGIVA